MTEKLQVSDRFSLQIDKSTDVMGIPREKIFRVTDNYLREKSLTWNMCVSLCTDGAACMTGRVKGFIAKVKAQNPHIVTNHCILHGEALVARIRPRS